MPLYFLIDTNIWINELAGTEDDKLIKWLEHLVAKDSVRLLVPSTLMKEWKRQSSTKIKTDQERFTNASKIARQAEGVVSSLDNYMDRMRDVEKRISALLQKGIQITESPEVNAETMRRFHNDIAPFHTNEKSNGDSLIYFSSVEYIQINELPGFILLTANSNEFGAPDSPKTNLHPDLLIDGLDIIYFNNLKGCQHSYKSTPGFEEILLPPAQLTPGTGIVTILTQNGAGMLEYLYKIMVEIRSQLAFVPCHLLARITPFKVKHKIKQGYTYYNNYTLVSNNSELLDFFESIDFRNVPRFKKNKQYENTPENLEQLAFVIKHLNNNLIFHITEYSSSRNIDIRPGQKNTVCNCLMCTYERMDLVTVLERLKHSENEDPHDAAFVAALIGFNEIAASLTIGLLQSAMKEEKRLLLYRLLFHINWLDQLTYTQDGIVDHAILKQWSSVDKDTVFKELLEEGGFWKDCADYFYNSYFEGDMVKDIYEAVHDIREHHSMQLHGGSSNNSNLFNLSAKFSEFENFLRENRMPFFRFSNFSKVFDQYTESIFLSFSLNEYQSSRILKFNDMIIRQLFLYGSPDIIIKMRNRFYRDEIPYNPDDKARPAIPMIRNFLRDLPVIFSMPEEELPEKSDFRHLFDRWRNALVLLSIIKFDRDFIRECARSIYGFLETRKNKNLRQVNELASFLATRLKVMDKNDQKKWLLLCITEKNYQSSELLFTFTQEHLKKKLLLTTSADFALVKEKLFPRYLNSGNEDAGPLMSLSQTMGNSNKKRLQDVIEKKLSQNINFNLFYAASIHKVIDPKKYLKQYTVHLVSMLKTRKADRTFFLEKDNYMYELDALVNLYFSLEEEIPISLIQRFKGSSPYYDWLLDMENFDYKKFKPIWVSLYTTRYYLRRIFSVSQVRIAVSDWLKTNTHEMIAKYYALYVTK